LQLVAGVTLSLNCADVTELPYDFGAVNAPLASAFGNDTAGNDRDPRWTHPWASPSISRTCSEHNLLFHRRPTAFRMLR